MHRTTTVSWRWPEPGVELTMPSSGPQLRILTEAITRARWIGVPTIVLGELHTGFALGSRKNENEAELQRFLDNTVVQVIDVDAEVAKVYSEILIDLRQQGTPIPTNDLWIAAVAAREGAPVLTYDLHFEHIRRIGVQILTA